ncbi:MAG TPA: hypothetical protein VL175_04815 [Pirellulales bacterium]|jgi:hypothetical protein|nr:hypothetical protein [Pirellulales bacterium]
MLQLLTDNPWLALCGLIAGVIVACTAIVVITDYFRKSHQAEIDAALKQDMLNRGMSAADIKPCSRLAPTARPRAWHSAATRGFASGWVNSKSKSGGAMSRPRHFPSPRRPTLRSRAADSPSQKSPRCQDSVHAAIRAA